VPAIEYQFILSLHPVDDLASLLEGLYSLGDFGEAAGAPSVLLPAGAEANEEPLTTHEIHRRGHLGQKGGVAVAVAGDHLPDLNVFDVAREAGADRPALKRGLFLGTSTVWRWS
jgi:hypothetical protein